MAESSNLCNSTDVILKENPKQSSITGSINRNGSNGIKKEGSSFSVGVWSSLLKINI